MITDERLDEIRRLDENDAPNLLADAVGDLLDEIECPSPRGKEAEELRRGLEALLRDSPGGDDLSNEEWRVEIVALLDRVDARDSLAFVTAESAQS